MPEHADSLRSDGGPKLKVWDPTVRMLHWTLVVAFVIAWASAEGWLSVSWHEPAGYVLAVVIATRAIWGFVGSRYAQFSQFIRGPRAVWSYTRQLLRASEPRFIGHNPLGAWMVLALMSVGAFTAFSGWLYTTDRYWGSDAVSLLHAIGAWILLTLVGVHVLGVIYTSLRHRENLVAAMFTGKKPAGESSQDRP